MKSFFTVPKVLSLIAVVFAVALAAAILIGKQYQQDTTVAPSSSDATVIGVVQYVPGLNTIYDGFRERMEELGYVEGEHVRYEFVSTNANIREVPGLVQELIAKDVDLIVAITGVAGKAALDGTIEANRTDIPILYLNADHAVDIGLAESYESSGNHTTGIEVNHASITERKVDFLSQLDSSVETIGVVIPSFSDPAQEFTMIELENAAAEHDMTVRQYVIQSPPGPDGVAEGVNILENIQPGEIDAFFQTPGPIVGSQAFLQAMIDASRRLQVPMLTLSGDTVEMGALFSYSDNNFAQGRQGAAMAQKILSGIPPDQIPIEHPVRMDLIINAKTAEEIGLTIPDDLRRIATEIIEE